MPIDRGLEDFVPAPFDRAKSCCIAGVKVGKTSFDRREGDMETALELWPVCAAADELMCSTAAAMMFNLDESSVIVF